jgi:hypothetical protein
LFGAPKSDGDPGSWVLVEVVPEAHHGPTVVHRVDPRAGERAVEAVDDAVRQVLLPWPFGATMFLPELLIGCTCDDVK